MGVNFDIVPTAIFFGFQRLQLFSQHRWPSQRSKSTALALPAELTIIADGHEAGTEESTPPRASEPPALIQLHNTHLRNVQAERVEGHEHALVHHHGTRPVGLADVGVGGVAVDGVSARQVPRVRVDRRVHRHTGADAQNKDACYESLRRGESTRNGQEWTGAWVTTGRLMGRVPRHGRLTGGGCAS